MSAGLSCFYRARAALCGDKHVFGFARHEIRNRARGMTTALEWEGAVGDVWAREWRLTDRSFSGMTPALNAAILAVAPDNGRAIDVGCGAGETSIAVAEARPDLEIGGIDICAALVGVARERAGGLRNLSFAAGDVLEALPQLAPVDLLFSRHGVMFFADPVAGFSTLRRAMPPGGPIVFSCFRAAQLNGWAEALIAAVTGEPLRLPNGYAPGPFAFADPDIVTAILSKAGWRDIAAKPVDFPYVAGIGPDPEADALAFFRVIGPTAPLLRATPPERRAAVMARFAEIIAKHRDGDRVTFPGAAWIWTARAGGQP
jgi:SAM-dependent methyltransferase